MTQYLKEIVLDFSGGASGQRIVAKQGDKKSRFLKISPILNGQQFIVETDCTIDFRCTKPDKTTVRAKCTQGSDGKITVELPEQALAVTGDVKSDIAIIGNQGEVLSSSEFIIEVRGTPDTEEYLPSEDYFKRESDIDMNNHQLKNLSAPQDAHDAANKEYVDGKIPTGIAQENGVLQLIANGEKVGDGVELPKTPVDSELSAESENPVQNKVIKAELEKKLSNADGSVKSNHLADGQITEDKLSPEVVFKLNNAINSWKDVQNAVRLGLGANLFPVGYEFTTPDSTTGTDITWVVRGHDHHRPANSRLTHSMTIEMKYVYSKANGTQKAVQYDAAEALYYAEDGLAAGTYHFTVENQTWFADNNGKSFQFSLSEAVPAGGQVVVSATYSQTFAGKSVKTYASPSSTTAIETATLAEGNGGTSLGTTNGEGNINHLHRIILGSNNYAQCAARQWLNSAATAGSVWTPTNKFDRAPSWATTYNGFMHGLPSDFLAVVEPAVIPCCTNNVYECASLDGTEYTVKEVYELQDKFFLLSRPEIYGSWDSTLYKDGELLDYYDGLTTAERKKFDKSGSVCSAWMRSPHPSTAGNTRIIVSDGSLSNPSAYNSFGITPACIIA